MGRGWICYRYGGWGGSLSISGRETTLESEAGSQISWSRVTLNAGRNIFENKTMAQNQIAQLGGLLPTDINVIRLKARSTVIAVPNEYLEDLTLALDGELINEHQLFLKPLTIR